MKLPFSIPKQLTKLQFYGLAASAFWALAITFSQRQAEMPKAQQYAINAYYTCTEHKAQAGDHNIDTCLDQVEQDWDDWMNRKWDDIAKLVLLPVAAGWLVGFACVRIYRLQKSSTKEKS